MAVPRASHCPGHWTEIKPVASGPTLCAPALRHSTSPKTPQDPQPPCSLTVRRESCAPSGSLSPTLCPVHDPSARDVIWFRALGMHVKGRPGHGSCQLSSKEHADFIEFPSQG